ncbi:hypothetical protein [Nocardioides sp.]|uniref:hypothetical protein n=1 Tax=Nocardioides sp. TaxID=35761 RepID=UPI0019A5EBFA|nr:hypothetical protein [Nocardioides sp.]MBC7276773.1 hypothetical protein [Nocardioides sp.]
MSHQQLPAEGPDDPDYTDDTGQVSETGRLDEDESSTPIAPSDATAGYPDSESGSPDTQGSGPSEPPPENRRDNDV